MHSGACTIKIVRQPIDSTRGAPKTTPNTGAPAVVKLQNDSGITLSWGSNKRLIYAIAAGPVADPALADKIRNVIIDAAFHATAVKIPKKPANKSPSTNTRL